MTTSCGFILSLENSADFYKIKNILETIEHSRLIYCTISTPGDRLYIKKESELKSGVQR